MKKAMKERILKKDSSFIPKVADVNDEYFLNGIFIFNISKMLEHIKDNPQDFTPEKLVLKEFKNPFSVIDEENLERVDCGEPVILAEISPGNFNLIDGNHRVEKARREGRESVLVYRVGPEFHMNFLISEKAYDKYIEYWNGKVEELCG